MARSAWKMIYEDSALIKKRVRFYLYKMNFWNAEKRKFSRLTFVYNRSSTIPKDFAYFRFAIFFGSDFFITHMRPEDGGYKFGAICSTKLITYRIHVDNRAALKKKKALVALRQKKLSKGKMKKSQKIQQKKTQKVKVLKIKD